MYLWEKIIIIKKFSQWNYILPHSCRLYELIDFYEYIRIIISRVLTKCFSLHISWLHSIFDSVCIYAYFRICVVPRRGRKSTRVQSCRCDEDRIYQKFYFAVGSLVTATVLICIHTKTVPRILCRSADVVYLFWLRHKC